MRLAASLLFATLIVAPAWAQDSASAVSVDRVRAALERPPSKLVLEERKPDFSIQVVWHHPFHEIFDKPAWQLDPVGWQPPGVGFNIISVFQSMMKSVSDAQYARAERAAKAEVQQAILDYCAGQPDAKGVEKICGSPAR
jgi:hypothetical protein